MGTKALRMKPQSKSGRALCCRALHGRGFRSASGAAFLTAALFCGACDYQPPAIPKGAQRITAGLYQYRTADWHTVYYPDGKLYIKGHLKNGVPSGLWQYFTHDGRVTTTGSYKDGLRTGRWEFRNSTGGLYMELHYAPEPKRLDYLLLSGNKVGNENGPYRRYYENGEIEEEGSYLGGSLEGRLRHYYPGKRLAYEGMYRSDRKHGKWSHYYPDGSLKREAHYQNGRLHGRIVNYYKNGGIYNISFYENGIRKGRPEIREFAARK